MWEQWTQHLWHKLLSWSVWFWYFSVRVAWSGQNSIWFAISNILLIFSPIVGSLLAQGLVVGASRDLQRQKLSFPFAVPLSPQSCQVWARGRDWHLQAGLARGSRGLSLAPRSWQHLPDVFWMLLWMLLSLSLQPAAASWCIRDPKSGCVHGWCSSPFFLFSFLCESTYGTV